MPEAVPGLETSANANDNYITPAQRKAKTDSWMRMAAFCVGVGLVILVVIVMLLGTKDKIDDMVKIVMPIGTWLVGFAIGKGR